jgi:hypothetical protein
MPVALVRLLVERFGAIRRCIVTGQHITLVLDPAWLVTLNPPRGN